MNNLKLNPKDLRNDLVPGITAAIASIPDAMASAVMAGINPVQGLYAYIVGTPLAALTTSSVFMAVTTTSAMALATGSALAEVPSTERLPYVVMLTILIGAFQIIAGLFKLGSLTRFVSNAVMTGFLTGVAVLIILGQLSDFTGYSSTYSNKVLQSLDTVLHYNQVDWPTLGIGVFTLALILLLRRTRLANFSMLLALAAAAILVQVLSLSSVTLVGDTAEIPNSLPTPIMPDLRLAPQLLLSAMAIGIIGLVQGAGVGQTYPNPDGKYPDASRDFLGQGIANVAAGFFRGMPMGGSVGSTSLAMSAGATSRWTNILTGVFIAIGVLLFGSLIEKLPMTGLAAILILAGFETINTERIEMVRDTSLSALAAMGITFLATLVLPIQAAVFLGVVVSSVLYLYQASATVRLVEIVPVPDGLPEERPAPAELASNQVTILDPYGSLFFAGARMFEAQLPAADQATRAVVILSLRPHHDVGSTLLGVLTRYARLLQQNGGLLMIAGVGEHVMEQMERTEMFDVIGAQNVFPATPRLGESVNNALIAARAWLDATP